MKILTPNIQIIGALILILGVACKKSRTELVTLHTWKVKVATINGSVDTTNFENYRITFKDDNNFVEVGADNSIIEGEWSINRDRSIVTLSQANGSLTDLNIVTLSEDEFHYNITSSVFIERVLIPAD